jgi:hypothetical protein
MALRAIVTRNPSMCLASFFATKEDPSSSMKVSPVQGREKWAGLLAVSQHSEY